MTTPAKKHDIGPPAWRIGLPWPFGLKVEDPIRISEFAALLRTLKWGQNDCRAALVAVFDGVTDLVQAELRYYFQRRKASRSLSASLRFLTWLLVSIGILIPIAAPLLSTKPDNFLSWGYVVFALAGVALAADKVFAGTDAHQRYVSAQLRIEYRYSDFALQWQQAMLSFDSNPGPEQAKQALQVAAQFMQEFHALLQGETDAWGKAMAEAVAMLNGKIAAGNAAKPDPAPAPTSTPVPAVEP